MLLFPPSSIQQPLQDSTNRQHLNRSLRYWRPTPRNHSHLTDLGTAKVKSSDSAIYNASTTSSCISDNSSVPDFDRYSNHSSVTSDHEPQPFHQRAKSEGAIEHDVVRFVNRPHGTPLFTIAEQRSLATLRTQISLVTFRSKGLTVGSNHFGHPKSASVDDTTLSTNRKGSTRATEGSSSLDELNMMEDPVQPLQPPFTPPHRSKTPDGVPRWPQGTRDSLMRRLTRTLNAARSSSPRSGTRILIRTLQGEIRNRRRVQPRTWRPPVSGHATYGYGHPSDHPLNSVRSADLPPPDHGNQHEAVVCPIPEPTPAEGQSLDRRCRSTSASASVTRRALGAIDGNAIPVNPTRRLGVRSISLPQNLRAHRTQDPCLSLQSTSQPAEPYPSETLRTTELIESFPLPPSRLSTKTRGKLNFHAPVPQRAPSQSHVGDLDTLVD
jgi:hypothetical protein